MGAVGLVGLVEMASPLAGRSQGAYFLERISSGSPWVGMSSDWSPYASCRARGGLSVAMEINKGAPDFRSREIRGTAYLVFNCFISHP